MRKEFNRSVLMVLLGLTISCLASSQGRAAVIIVDSAAGDLVDQPGADGSGNCSFREAMGNAFNESGIRPHDDCEGSTPGGPNTLTFTVGTITLDTIGSVADIRNDLTIQGPVIFDGNSRAMPVFRVVGSANAILNQIVIRNCDASPVLMQGDSNLTINLSSFDDNSSTNGGAINAGGSGTLIINGSAFTRNSASANGGAINKGSLVELFVSASSFGAPGLGNSAGVRGGAIYIGGVATGEAVVIDATAFLDNESMGTNTGDGGGAIYVFSADTGSTITLLASLFGDALTGLSGNTAASRGGAIYNNADDGGWINTSANNLLQAGVIGCEFVGNQADGPEGSLGLGGAIYNQGTMHIFNSTFEGNASTNSSGGAIGDNQGLSGQELIVANSTFNGNTAAVSGGGISLFNSAGNAILRNVTLADNIAASGRELHGAGDFDLGNVIIANALAGESCSGSGTFTDNLGNLLFGGAASCGLTPGSDPELQALALNPGPIPVRTMALGNTSAALGIGFGASCSGVPVLSIDARGIPRPLACDAGAFEGGDTARLVINEIDYDQGGTDDHEFVEIFNAGTESIDLAPVSLQLIDGDLGGAVEYSSPSIDLLAGTLAPGEFFVVCGQTGGDLPPVNCDQDLPTDVDFLQDGNPDAIGLRLSGILIDAVSYGGESGSPYVEGMGAPVDDGSQAYLGISRFPDGTDSQDNSVDFTVRCATPALPNESPASACGVVPVELLKFSVE